MILSLVKIEFIPVTGDPILLLDHGDGMRDFVRWPMQQGDFATGAIGGAYATGISLGNTAFTPAWTRRVLHDTDQAAEAWCLDHPATMPKGVQGKFRYSIYEGNVYEYKHARVLACQTVRLITPKRGKQVTVTEYRGMCGERVLVSTATPGSPEPTPGEVPSLLPGPPSPLPLLARVNLSGITNPVDVNGPVPKTGLSEGYLVFHDADVTIQRVANRWRIQGSAGRGFEGQMKDYPWQVTTWTPFGGATGTPTISPVWAG